MSEPIFLWCGNDAYGVRLMRFIFSVRVAGETCELGGSYE